ncbi:hypothetical protein [Actinokineospora sp. HUAS TT18]|uniref:hypothetical protein n=1 Tax=Actinokineospora sp. HUAS TT18 TaxID=3447451 RepID=UPI003F51E3EA
MEGQRREFGSLVGVLLCVLAAGAAALSLVVAGVHWAVPVPAVVYGITAAVMAWASVGRLRVTRVALGLVLVGASAGLAALLYFASGWGAASAGVALLVLGVGFTFLGLRAAAAPTSKVQWLPLVLVAAAVVLIPVMYLPSRSLPMLGISVLFLGAAAGRVCAAPYGPARLDRTAPGGRAGSISSPKQQSR